MYSSISNADYLLIIQCIADHDNPPAKKRKTSTSASSSAASRVRCLACDIVICNKLMYLITSTINSVQVLKTSKQLNNNKENLDDVEEEVLGSETDLDERSTYKVENDARIYRNKVMLHDTVLV